MRKGTSLVVWYVVRGFNAVLSTQHCMSAIGRLADTPAGGLRAVASKAGMTPLSTSGADPERNEASAPELAAAS